MISIIIPVLNEAANLPPLLRALSAEPTAHEVVVADGGSTDGTAIVSRGLGARVVTSSTGRGNQICRGVAESAGDILFFLHADSIFPAGGLTQIDQTLRTHPEFVGGNFRLVFDGDTAFSRWLTRFYGRIRALGFYYGDSGIFVRRSAYEAMGGLRPIPIMEDLDFVRRLERHGKTCCIMEPPLITSSRRFEGRWAPAIVYGWAKLHTLFWLGVSPERLAAMYGAQKPRGPASGRSE